MMVFIASTSRRPSLKVRAIALACAGLAGLAIAGGAQAQTMNANSASFNAGYGRTPGQENQPVDVSMRDANGNLVVVDGQIQAGAFASAGVGGTFSGAGGVSSTGSATAIGNNLSVITQGDYNTVIVTSVQTNTGDVTATAK
jgi:holdfast attachment protein HfaA